MMIGSKIQLWKNSISWAIGVAASWKPIWPGAAWPSPAACWAKAGPKLREKQRRPGGDACAPNPCRRHARFFAGIRTFNAHVLFPFPLHELGRRVKLRRLFARICYCHEPTTNFDIYQYALRHAEGFRLCALFVCGLNA